MGLFSKKKNEKPVELKPNINTWFDDYDNWQGSDYDKDKIDEAWKSFLEELGTHLSAPKFLLPDEGAEREHFELRGRYEDIPVKIMTDTMMYEYDPVTLDITMKLKGFEGYFDLTRDLEKIPIEKDTDEDWGEEDQTVRVFVAKGIFAEDYEDEVQQTLSIVKALPQDLMNNLLKLIEEIPILYFRISYGELEIFLDVSPVYMENPIEKYLALLNLVVELAKNLGNGDISKDNVNKEILTKYKRVKCTYCSSMFLMGLKPNCPNCGGNYEE